MLNTRMLALSQSARGGAIALATVVDTRAWGRVGVVCGAGARVLRVCAGRVCILVFLVVATSTAFVAYDPRTGAPDPHGALVGAAMVLCGGARVLAMIVCDRVLVCSC